MTQFLHIFVAVVGIALTVEMAMYNKKRGDE